MDSAPEAAAKRTCFFAHLATITAYDVFPSWTVFLEAFASFTIPARADENPKN